MLRAPYDNDFSVLVYSVPRSIRSLQQAEEEGKKGNPIMDSLQEDPGRSGPQLGEVQSSYREGLVRTKTGGSGVCRPRLRLSRSYLPRSPAVIVGPMILLEQIPQLLLPPQEKVHLYLFEKPGTPSPKLYKRFKPQNPKPKIPKP